MSTRTAPRAVLPALLAALALLLTAACQGGEAPSSEGAASDSPTSAGEEPARWPFTGTRVPDGREPTAPAVAVKIDNTSSSRPQAGLDGADLVVQELVEGGKTRLATFFQRNLPTTVGPVRSMRDSDVGIIGPAGVPAVTSGAAGVVGAALDQAGVRRITQGNPGLSRAGDRPAPYDLMADLRRVGRDLGQRKQPPPAYLPWRAAARLPQGRKAHEVVATFSRSHTTRFRFADGTYRRVGGFAAPGKGFRPDTVLVLRVRVGDAGYRDPAGNPVPETKFQGKGEALLAHDGRVVRGTWRKKSLQAPLRLRRQGTELGVPPGRTWVALVPRGNGSVTTR